MWWFAVFTAVPVTFSVGFLAGTLWRTRIYVRSLEATLTTDVQHARLQPLPQPVAPDGTLIYLPPSSSLN